MWPNKTISLANTSSRDRATWASEHLDHVSGPWQNCKANIHIFKILVLSWNSYLMLSGWWPVSPAASFLRFSAVSCWEAFLASYGYVGGLMRTTGKWPHSLYRRITTNGSKWLQAKWNRHNSFVGLALQATFTSQKAIWLDVNVKQSIKFTSNFVHHCFSLLYLHSFDPW